MLEQSLVGKSLPRIDALEKVTGKAMYSMDLKLPGMLYCKILRSPYPHARIIKVDTSKAESLAKVRAVVTGKDVPTEKWGAIQDRPILARDIVRFAGEAVAAVAADSIEAAEEALQFIEVDYEQLPAIFDAEEAMKANAPVIVHPDLFQYVLSPLPYPLYRFVPDLPNVYLHREIRRGDTQRGFRESNLVIENRFSLPMVQHCALEPHNAIARSHPDGGLTVWLTTNALYQIKLALGRLFRLPSPKVRLISFYVGGSFGGKMGITVPAIAALMALKTGKPVKLVLSRDEVFVDGTSREAMVIYIKDGVRVDGTLLAREMKLILNAGAYSGMTTVVAKNAAFGAVGTYKVSNFKLDSYAVATNEPPTGPFRGFGSTEVIWAIESQMDMLAEKLSIDPVEIRKINLLKEGDEDVCGMITHSIGARECLDKVTEWIRWDEKSISEEGHWKRGKGIALGNKYTMAGTASVVNVKVHQDATIEIRHSACEIGQGCNTILAQIAAEEFGTSIDKVKVVYTDTAITPYDYGTLSSRTTFHNGNALRLACRDAKYRIFEMASERLGVPPSSLNIKDGVINVIGGNQTIKVADLFTTLGYLPKGGEILGSATYTGPLIENEDAETGQCKRPVTYYAHGANAVEVAVNLETGEVKVIKVGTSFDMGHPINPKLCEGQLEGGMAMGIGGALYEEIVSQNGVVVNPTLMDYKLPSSLDVPAYGDVKSMMAAAPHREGPFGAKGFSEGALVAMAPAIANAIYGATGVRIKDLPITKQKVLKALKDLRSEVVR